ncbi:MAG TPA: CarD family transcriptional regulator [Bacilli bacterium]|nr:CarD family transcriptional regulator [Bacilli bacterium]HPS18896.1 CarD family transcriptional regulator [Bacilli bacterium]
MERFKVNDEVMHCRDGLSVIIGTKEMGGKTYFLVRANRSDAETIYVPFDSINEIIRPIMNIEEADLLLKKISIIEKEFNPNTKQRRDAYKRRLCSGDVEDIAYLFAQYRAYKRDPEGVKLGAADVDMLEYANNFILDEFATCYRVKRENIYEFIDERIKKIK